jgi:hypothetical protein
MTTTGAAAAEGEAVAAVRSAVQAEHPYPAERFEGRGIVVCAGGARLFTCAWVGLWLLRRALGCRLPIEVWHLGRGELGPTEAGLLSELEVTTVDALVLRSRYPARTLGGWELKPYALANCRFREVMLLDADNIAIRDPAFLFDAQPYVEAGALFWPDQFWFARDNGIWELCGLEPTSVPTWESGQLVLDKARCWAPLQVVQRLNDYSEVFYRYLYGDKDTFRLAWLLRQSPCAMVARRPRATDWGLLQHDLDGEPLLQHRNQAKWTLRGENPITPDFRHGDACLSALAELGRRWSGRIEAEPERSRTDRELEAKLAAVRLFRLERVGWDACVLELLPGNREGEGRTLAWQRWYVVDGALRLEGVPGVTARLTPDGDERWSGRSEERGRHELAMRPLEEAPGDALSAVVAALMDRVASGAVPAGDAAAALVTLSSTGDMPLTLTRERTRWSDGSPPARAIDEARWRLGRRDPSLRSGDGGEARRFELR